MSMTGNIGFSTTLVFVTIIERGSQSRSFSSRMSPVGSAQRAGTPGRASTRTSGKAVLVIIAGISLSLAAGRRPARVCDPPLNENHVSDVTQPGVAAAGLDAGEPAA